MWSQEGTWRCTCDYSMAEFFDKYLTPIIDSFLNGRLLRPACKALSRASGKRRHCWYYARYFSNFATIKESHLYYRPLTTNGPGILCVTGQGCKSQHYSGESPISILVGERL